MSFIDEYYAIFNNSVGQSNVTISRAEFANLLGVFSKQEKQIDQFKEQNEELKKQLMQKSEVDMFFNTPIEGWSSWACKMCPHKAESEQLKEELSSIQHNCNREGCKYYDDDTFKVFYECKVQKALQLSTDSITTKYCDLLQTLNEVKKVAKPYQKEIKKICGNCNNYDDCHACCKFDLNCYQYKKGDTTACEKFIVSWRYDKHELANKILQKIKECEAANDR